MATIGVLILTVAALDAQRIGTVRSVTARATGEAGVVEFVVRGDNPCGAVFLDFGDGEEGITYAITQLPATLHREYFKNGTFQITARGMGNCNGSAPGEVRVTRARPAPPRPTKPATPPAPAIRFAEMDTNGDGEITRAEWRGSLRSFNFHDWNNDGVLSGDEVRLGAPVPGRGRGRSATMLTDWSEARFRQLDRNNDERLSRGEWRYDVEDFIRADRNGDNQLTLREFLIGDVDDDRGDRFDDLDVNGNNRIERGEWHGSRAAFEWLDRNNDGVLTRAEVVGADLPATGGRTRAGVREQPRTSVVSAQRDWVDTGITLQAGDMIDVSAVGRVQYAPGSGDVASAAGAAGRQATPAAPMPNREIGALIGRIGDGAPFYVGESLDAHTASSAGRLYLRINDDVLTDNRGQFRATITVTRR